MANLITIILQKNLITIRIKYFLDFYCSLYKNLQQSLYVLNVNIQLTYLLHLQFCRHKQTVGTFKNLFGLIFWIFIVTYLSFSTKFDLSAHHVRSKVRIMRFLELPFIYRAICKLQADTLRTNASWHYRTGPVLITHLHSFQCRATFSRGHLANWYSSLELFDLSAAPITAISLMYRIVEQMSNLAKDLPWLIKLYYI